MPHVAALYRYPVKGLTPEPRAALTVLADGRVAGDRVLGLRFASTAVPDDAWSPKAGMLVLMNTPALARLEVRFDEARRRLAIRLGGETLVEAGLDERGRERIAAAVAAYALGATPPPRPLSVNGEGVGRLPLRLVGDGVTPRYHDSEAGDVTLHGTASLRALAGALRDPELSGLRFRSNVVVEGLEAWEELGWVGRRVRIGALEFRVRKAKTRCLATHVNPATGLRDRPVLSTLVEAFGQEEPTFAVALTLTSGPGELRLGDEVRVLG